MKTTKTPISPRPSLQKRGNSSKPVVRKCKHDFAKLVKQTCSDGYLGETYLATFLSKTHKQKQCPNCGLYAIWIYGGKPNKHSHDDYGRIERDLL